ncbi:50S ribosomal subunit protein L17 (modular protein) [uncultured Desulfobacterium sp.]|uniref:Large ribosomal subunit protein bL17 n=1 Tax=uncultured Desulfobacterium sp. TaxID=201089 RepID=A0A445MS32_9BACT|nr:50S ribosomal subunit protein L17 (modular protein) [uncultured Desulfobacterium sp.]
MRHRKAWKHLSRNSSHRKALLRNLVTSLLKHGQIVTTDAKAKSVRPLTEKMITLAKRGDLHARRQALAYLQEKDVANKLFDELKGGYLDRQGGYVRIVKKGIRKGDGAPVSIVQLVSVEAEKRPVKKKPKAPKTADQAPVVAVQEKAEESAPETHELAAVSEETKEASSDEEAKAGDTIEAKDEAVVDNEDQNSADLQTADGDVKEKAGGSESTEKMP